MEVEPVPPLVIASAVPDQLELLMLDRVASEPRPRLVRAVPASDAFVPPLAIGKMPETCVVRLTPDRVPPRVSDPEEVTVPVRVIPFTVPVPETEVTVPTPEPAPIAVRKSAAFSALTVLSALNLGNVTADGLVKVNRLPPIVVAPRLVRAPDAKFDPVPPCKTGSGVPSVRVVRWFTASTTLTPSLYTHMVLPAGTVMPVPAAVLMTILSAQSFCTM